MANSLARFVIILTGASMLLFGCGALAAVPRYTGPPTPREPGLAELALMGLAAHPVVLLSVLSAGAAGALMLAGPVSWRLGAIVLLATFTLFGSAALLSDIASAMAR